jgi:glycosyltransferase involved in cell wall biosynthesis
MSGVPLVSIVIPVLDGGATIGDTLTGLLNQAPRSVTAEILVVDNGSTDDTRAIVERFPVALLTEPTRGPAAARNRGLRAARGAIVAHLDADTLPTHRWLAEIAAPFADPAVTQVAGRMLGYRPSTPVERYYARRFLDREEENARAEGFPFAAAGNMAVRREAALAVGGWDEGFRVGQDVDLSYRLLRRFAAPIHYQAGAVVFVRTSRTMAELRGRAFKYGQGRARLWVRHRDAAGWGPRRALRVAAGLTVSAVWPSLLRGARWARCATDEDVRAAEFHRAWTWSLWRGFASMARYGEWRQLEVDDTRPHERAGPKRNPSVLIE